MRYGFVLPGGSAPEQLELAVLAEQAGWDGVFVWEGPYAVDAWTLLAAVSQRTERVRLGTMLTPLPWRRPWKLASQVATLDQLSSGRAILAVGLGAPDVGNTGEIIDRKLRAERLDEGLDILYKLWQGELTYSGKHYELALNAEMAGNAGPVQQPHPPVWCVGLWPRPKSMQRILRCDGLIASYLPPGGEAGLPAPEQIREMLAWLRERGGAADGFDVIMEGETPASDLASAQATVQPWIDAGCTWWLETRWQSPGEVRERIAAGPPR